MIIACGICITGILVICIIFFVPWKKEKKEVPPKKPVEKPEITQMLLSPNPYSRPELPLKEVKGIVVHYTANPGSSAVDNRDYFEGLQFSHKTYASSHFVIGLDGEIIQCIPLDEISYASNSRNKDTISIECCHKDKNGKFTNATYKSLVNLTVWLCQEFDLTEKNILRHYDVTGKNCPKYYVEHEEQWKKFLQEIGKNR